MTDFSGHLPKKLEWKKEESTLGKFEFFSLGGSSDGSIMDGKRNTSFMTENIFEVLFGFLEIHTTEDSTNFESVFVVHTNVSALSFSCLFLDLRFSAVFFHHC